jgi:hypothetical protein
MKAKEYKGDEIYMAGWRWKRGTAGTPMKRIQIEKTDDTAALNRPVGGGIVFLMILEMGGWGGRGWGRKEWLHCFYAHL